MTMGRRGKRVGYRNSPASQVFDREQLARICEMPESKFGEAFDLLRVDLREQRAPFNYFYFRQTESNILAVAHLDTVAKWSTRKAHFLDTSAGEVVFSRALDDRLGAYIILDMLPKLGITTDILLTTGEEVGMSTAEYFDSDKKYNWVIEFDRGGTDVVMYQYEDPDMRALVRASGAWVGMGSLSDISYLDHLGVKCFNWGTGYEDYHSARSHAFLDDTFKMVDRFCKFHETNRAARLEHVPRWRSFEIGGVGRRYGGGTSTSGNYAGKDWLLEAMSDDELAEYFDKHSFPPEPQTGGGWDGHFGG